MLFVTNWNIPTKLLKCSTELKWRADTLLGHHGPSPPTCFGSKNTGPCCLKTVWPSNSPNHHFQNYIPIPILHEKSEKMRYNRAQYFNFQLKSSSSLVCFHCQKNQSDIYNFCQTLLFFIIGSN